MLLYSKSASSLRMVRLGGNRIRSRHSLLVSDRQKRRFLSDYRHTRTLSDEPFRPVFVSMRLHFQPGSHCAICSPPPPTGLEPRTIQGLHAFDTDRLSMHCCDDRCAPMLLAPLRTCTALLALRERIAGAILLHLLPQRHVKVNKGHVKPVH